MSLLEAPQMSGGPIESIVFLLALVAMVLIVDRLFFRLAMEVDD
jgi:hypothetical protein